MLVVIQELYGGSITKKGDAYFINCPNPAHNDRHASCYTKDGWNNVTCTSCGYYAQAIDLIQQEKGLEFPEACDLLWELEGRPTWYKEYNVNTAKKTSNKKELSNEELNFLSLRGWEDYLTREQFKKVAFLKCKHMYQRYKKMRDEEKSLYVNKLAKKIRSL